VISCSADGTAKSFDIKSGFKPKY